MRLAWSRHALADREGIFDYIARENPRAAIAIDDRIMETVARLNDFPLSGRQGRVDGTRELVVARTPFILIYRLEPECTRILRVLHGARKWPRV